MLPKTDRHLDMRVGEHRALVFRAYFHLLSLGEERDAALLRAPKLAREWWQEGKDYPGFYPRRWMPNR
jgi:hypothetical protein